MIIKHALTVPDKAFKYAIGLMSGTSLDGVDVVLVKLQNSGVETKCEVLAFKTYPFSEGLRTRIMAASDPKTACVGMICSLNFELGIVYSEAVSHLLKQIDFKERLDFIASHGQTIYHQPRAISPLFNSTLQIGDPSKLAYDHHTPVVFNFRAMDIVDGGDGAPLVPYSEYILYRQKTKSILLQNIGGIGNVTVIPKNCTLAAVWAFDTGPGNMMINIATTYYYQKPYDQAGQYAAKGRVINELFEQLCRHEYLAIHPPKSTGRELFGERFVIELCQRYPSCANDVIYTLTKFSAYTIAKAYQTFIFSKMDIDQIIVGGGGAYNPMLMAELRAFLPEYNVLVQEALGFSSEAKEAIAFAILGNETLHNKPSNIPKATGSKHRLILGQIAPNPWGD